jgi:hypothetical protein
MADKVYKYILDFKGKSDQLQKEVGGVKGLLKGAALAAGALFAADKVMDAAKAVADYAKQISAVKAQVEKLTGLQGAALNKVTGQVQAIASAYNQDVNETLKATNALMKGFGESGTKAYEAINSGLSTAANANGDFLKQVQEYSVHFKEAGLSASEMVAVISESNRMGVFDDKGADAIKEGTIRLREMAQGTRDALNAIGLSSTKIQADISAGNKSMFEVMQLVSKQLKTLPEQAPAVGMALADIFGGPGEDAVQFIRSLADINTELGLVIKNSGEASKVQMEWSNELARFNTLGATVFGGTSQWITKVKADLLNFLNNAVEALLISGSLIAGFVRQIYYPIELAAKGIYQLFDTAAQLMVAFATLSFSDMKGIIKSGMDSYVQMWNDFGQKSGQNYTSTMKTVLDTFFGKKEEILAGATFPEIEIIGKKAGSAFANGYAQTYKSSGKGASLTTALKPLSGGMIANSYNVYAVDQNQKVIQSNAELSESYFQLGNIAASTLGSLAQGFGESAAGWLNFAGTLLQQAPIVIANIMAMAAAHRSAALANIAASEGETMASAATGAAKLPFPANLIAIGATIAAVAAMFAAIPRAEFGGIVPGNSFSGDKQMIRVNSGEEVLRRDDPRHALNQSGRQGGGSIINILQDGITIDGNKLRILLKKEERRVSLRAIPVG